MEIGATSLPSYLPPQLAEPRGARTSAREGFHLQDSVTASGMSRKESSEQKHSLIAVQARQNTAQTNRLAESSDNRSSINKGDELAATPTEASSASRQPIEILASGSIKMDVEDGNRVLQVYDSKDVLIYQLPPKGALMLIKAQEHTQQPQVQTSA